ncbi:hypothetical protein [Granulicella arctica]|uniref:Lipoprotein n=1 Tax=Granulicella arctica TaxID=940613 RepID=A0A7Y9PIP6_9BACT|nr:hypothetical protein [Granulicella arctica]NYF80581.1 hypothetical protein [Granulicella arctica]
MKLSRYMLPLAAAAVLLTAGCAERTYVAAPPPPPPQGPPPLVEQADHNGFQAGSADGARDSYNGVGYHPKSDRKFHDAPGYDPRFGPFEAYRDYFRNAYLRGYYRGFYHQ